METISVETTFSKTKKRSVLAMSTIAFACNFAVWTLFSIIGIQIKDELALSETTFGILVATPILTGSISRLPFGLLTDRFGGRVVFLIQMLLVAIPTYGLAYATEYWQYVVIGLFVGLAGGSFAIGIAYTSACFSKARQGTVMGIFGAGNAGAALTNLIAPMILVAYGWRMVPIVYSVAMLIMAILFWVFTYQDPKQQQRQRSNRFPSLAEQLAPLKGMQVWRFGLYYYFVFGGFVALALWLPKYYVSEYGLDLKTASLITLAFTLPSGVIRILGGWMSDRYGARPVNLLVFWVCAVCLLFISLPPSTISIFGIENSMIFTVLIFIIGIAQGLGKASVYRIIHDYYPQHMGSVGGIVGVIGGLGGFSLPILFGIADDAFGVANSCFVVLLIINVLCMVWMNQAIAKQREQDQTFHALDTHFKAETQFN